MMRKKLLIAKNTDLIIFSMVCLYSFLYGLMFPLFGLNIQIIILGPIVIYELYRNKKLSIDVRFILLLITVCYIEIGFEPGKWSSTQIAILWILWYLLGKHSCRLAEGNKKMLIFLCLSWGLFLQGVLNYLYSWTGKGLLSADKSWGWMLEFWTGEQYLRTLYTFDFILIGSIFIIGVMFIRQNRLLSICIIISNIIIITLDFIISKGRTMICIQILTSILLGFIYIFKSNKVQKITIRKKQIKLRIGIIIMVLVGVRILELYKKIDLEFLGRDGGIIHNIRVSANIEAFHQMLLYPNGGWTIETLSMPHNVFLLFAQEYNIIVFILMVTMMLVGIADCIYLISGEMTLYKYMLIGGFLSINLYYLIETGPWSYRIYWMFLLMIYGMLGEEKRMSK